MNKIEKSNKMLDTSCLLDIMTSSVINIVDYCFVGYQDDQDVCRL